MTYEELVQTQNATANVHRPQAEVWDETRLARTLTTLRRLPDSVIIDVATRELIDVLPNACLCGWAVRASLAEELGVDASEVSLSQMGVIQELMQRYGGDHWEWHSIFSGICGLHSDEIEEAFTLRLEEALGVEA